MDMKPRAIYEAKGVIVAAGLFWLAALLFLPPLAVPAALGVLFILWFFRDPERQPPPDESLAVAPADGVVVAAGPEDGDGRLGGPVERVVIFLSIFDVHVNRAPIAGRIESSEESDGQYLDARRPESSVWNARRVWLIRGDQGTAVVVRQIAGLVARRIVAWRKPGDLVARGQRIGMIRFGSRTEADFPAGTQLLVRVGDRVRAGESPIARLSPIP